MTIKQFIEAAIEGGWEDTRPKVTIEEYPDMGLVMQALADRIHFPRIVIDPKAWEAVDKTLVGKESWLDPNECVACEYPGYQDAVPAKMYGMIKALLAGRTLEEYIATL